MVKSVTGGPWLDWAVFFRGQSSSLVWRTWASSHFSYTHSWVFFTYRRTLNIGHRTLGGREGETFSVVWSRCWSELQSGWGWLDLWVAIWRSPHCRFLIAYTVFACVVLFMSLQVCRQRWEDLWLSDCWSLGARLQPVMGGPYLWRMNGCDCAGGGHPSSYSSLLRYFIVTKIRHRYWNIRHWWAINRRGGGHPNRLTFSWLGVPTCYLRRGLYLPRGWCPHRTWCPHLGGVSIAWLNLAIVATRTKMKMIKKIIYIYCVSFKSLLLCSSS